MFSKIMTTYTGEIFHLISFSPNSYIKLIGIKIKQTIGIAIMAKARNKTNRRMKTGNITNPTRKRLRYFILSPIIMIQPIRSYKLLSKLYTSNQSNIKQTIVVIFYSFDTLTLFSTSTHLESNLYYLPAYPTRLLNLFIGLVG